MRLLRFVRRSLPALTRVGAAMAVGAGLFAIGACAVLRPHEPAPRPAEGPALWVIRDADSTLYLFGGVHVLRPGAEWLSPPVEAAYAAASEVWLEVADIDDQAAIAPLIRQHGISLDRPLSSLLTAEERVELDAAARAVGVSAAQMEPMRPWLAALTLSVAPAIKAGYDPASGVELALTARARQDGKPVRGFETLDRQVAIMADLDEANQLAVLRAALKDFDRAVEMLDELVRVWAVGDVGGLERVAVAPMKAESPVVYEALLTRRNADWADQIQTLLDGSGTVFIAVGAAHLAGEDSVQAMLARRGVAVARVTD